MDGDYFVKHTRFASIGQILEERYDEVGKRILQRACDYLERDIAGVDKSVDRTVARHMRTAVLPGCALYRAMGEFNIPEEDAIGIIEAEMCSGAEKKGRVMGLLGKLPFAYPLMRLIFKAVTKASYPAEGWAVSFGRSDSERLEVFIKSCLYCRELARRGCPELGRAFCKTDHIVYLPLAPNIAFSQSGTIAKGSECCDFVFFNGARNNLGK